MAIGTFFIGSIKGTTVFSTGKENGLWANFHINILPTHGDVDLDVFHMTGNCPKCAANVHVQTQPDEWGGLGSELHYDYFTLGCEECLRFLKVWNPDRIFEFSGQPREDEDHPIQIRVKVSYYDK